MLDRVDVLVCGGGPTGLLTGLGLARQGISAVVLGKCCKFLLKDVNPNPR